MKILSLILFFGLFGRSNALGLDELVGGKIGEELFRKFDESLKSLL